MQILDAIYESANQGGVPVYLILCKKTKKTKKRDKV